MAARSSLRRPGACDSLLLAATSRPSTSGYGSHGGFGKKPALLVIDVSYGFTGDKPEPILDSIKQWRNSCGAESWTAIAVIKELADLFRAKRLPVIYSTGFIREDNWDAGGWAWKNYRAAESAPVKSKRSA